MDRMDDIRVLLTTAVSAKADLNDAEKEQLRALSRYGGPIWKIIKSSVDYGAEMKEIIASAPLDTEEGVKLARQLQLKRAAALDFIAWFVQQFDEPSSRRVQQKDASRG